MRKLTKLSIAAAIIGVGSLLISYIGGPSQAAPTIDRTRDCDTVAIFYCGAMSESEFHSKWNNDKRYKDHQAVFNAFGIKKDDVRGMVNGIVWKDGRVTLEGGANNGKVVATNAMTAGRWNNPTSDMTRIAGTSRAYKMSTRHFVTDGQAAMIKLDKNGRFLFAVIKSCGNPVTATPPPAPKPQPKAQCTVLDTPAITNRTNVALTARASAQNGATISKYVFNIINAQGRVVQTKEVATSASTASTSFNVPNAGSYTAKVSVHTSLGVKEASACAKPFKIATPPPTPVAQCSALDKPVITNRTNVALRATASVSGGARITGYEFTATNASGNVVARANVTQASSPATANMTISQPGTYTIKVVVKTSLGDRTATACEKKITIEKPKTPSVSVDKKVDGVEHKQVGVDTEFKYNIRVTNTGETDLKQVKLIDHAPEGVTFLGASAGSIANNSWTHTLAQLKRGTHADFTITAKVPEYLAGTIKNTVCVDTPDVPGKPDDCDDATVEVPEPKKMIVCVLEDKEYPVTIKEEEFDPSKHSTDPEDCKEAPVTPPTPPELPQSGAADTLLNGLGLSALATSVIAYVASRRHSLV